MEKMKWKKWLENWDMTSLKIKTSFLDMEFKPQEADKAAAWDLYIELLTRITTQPLPKVLLKKRINAMSLEKS